MKNNKHRKIRKTALPPGSLVYTGEKIMDEIEIHLIDYDEKEIHEKMVKDIETCYPFKDLPTVTWVNINGLHDVGVIEKLGSYFHIHPLILEDVLSVNQRPKMENSGDILFVVLRMLQFDDEKNEIKSEQVSLILGKNFLFTFQEKTGDVFEPVRERLRQHKGRIRTQGADYLAYALLDAIVDNYFLVLEKMGDQIENLEELLVNNPSEETLKTIHRLKRDMIFLRKSVWPLRETINGLERSESTLILKSTEIYLKDVYDHTIQVIDTVESYRDMVSGMLDIYMSSVSNRMNEVMKVLTIIATIFIPLTFIAGIYGMNFEFMPELGWKWSYPLTWLIMIGVAVLMIFYFRRKKWL